MLTWGADSPPGIALPSWAVPRPKRAAQHAEVWVTPREGSQEGSLAFGENQGGRQPRASTRPQNAGKAQLGA